MVESLGEGEEEQEDECISKGNDNRGMSCVRREQRGNQSDEKHAKTNNPGSQGGQTNGWTKAGGRCGVVLEIIFNTENVNAAARHAEFSHGCEA
jgi:hypothetical protein